MQSNDASPGGVQYAGARNGLCRPPRKLHCTAVPQKVNTSECLLVDRVPQEVNTSECLLVV